MRYFIKLSYDGSAFCGWQLQPNAVTVQECLERTLTTLLREPVQVTGAGRTDSKVNAIGYVAHFDYDKVIDTSAFGYKLNAILPRGIVIHAMWPVDGDLHARFSASRREYTYFLHRTKDPFVETRSYFCPWPLDVKAMNEAAALLLGTHDFRCFEKSGSDNRTSICTVTEAFWTAYTPDHVAIMGYPAACKPASDDRPEAPVSPDGGHGAPSSPDDGPESPSSPDGGPESHSSPDDGPESPSSPDGGPLYLYFRIAADRFLRNMVRALVGSLVDVGRGRRSVSDFAALILPPDFDDVPDSAQPQASASVPVSSSTAPETTSVSASSSTSAPETTIVSNGARRRTAADGTPLRSLAGESVPGHALFLSRVDY